MLHRRAHELLSVGTLGRSTQQRLEGQFLTSTNAHRWMGNFKGLANTPHGNLTHRHRNDGEDEEEDNA